jgi:hypothetical protein
VRQAIGEEIFQRSVAPTICGDVKISSQSLNSINYRPMFGEFEKSGLFDEGFVRDKDDQELRD